jgi:O-antigen/teichoic acid export membrane protein
LASWPISWLYGDHRLVGITQALSVTFLINGIATQFKAQINRDLRFVLLGATDAIPPALGLATAIMIAATTHSYWALVAQVVTSTAFEALLCISCARWRPGVYRRDVPVGRFLRFAGSLVGTQALAYVSKNIDNVLLGVFRGPAELGIYSRAYQIVVLPLNQVTVPLSRVAIPILSRLQDKPQMFMGYIRTAQFATISVASVFYGAMIGFGSPLVHLVLGEQWTAVVPILQVLALSGIFRALGQVPYWLFVTLGHTSKQLLIYLIGQPIIIGSIAVGIIWGGIGVAAGCSIGYGIFWALNMWWAGRVSKLAVRGLALSGLALVTVFAIPVAATGSIAVLYFADSWISLAVGGLPAIAWVCAAGLGIPRYRTEVVRFIRLARNPRERPASL